MTHENRDVSSSFATIRACILVAPFSGRKGMASRKLALLPYNYLFDIVFFIMSTNLRMHALTPVMTWSDIQREEDDINHTHSSRSANMLFGLCYYSFQLKDTFKNVPSNFYNDVTGHLIYSLLKVLKTATQKWCGSAFSQGGRMRKIKTEKDQDAVHGVCFWVYLLDMIDYWLDRLSHLRSLRKPEHITERQRKSSVSHWWVTINGDSTEYKIQRGMMGCVNCSSHITVYEHNLCNMFQIHWQHNYTFLLKYWGKCVRLLISSAIWQFRLRPFCRHLTF